MLKMEYTDYLLPARAGKISGFSLGSNPRPPVSQADELQLGHGD